MFTITPIQSLWPGVEAKSVNFARVAKHPVTQVTEARSAFGRAVVVDLAQCDVDVLPFFDLINSNKGNDRSVGCRPEDAVNLGATVRDFVEGTRKDCSGTGVYASFAKRCLYASNTLHTNFVRANGFIVRGGKLIHKPDYAWGLDCDKFMPLDGGYMAFTMRSGSMGIENLKFLNGQEPLGLPDLAISGPVLIRNGKDESGEIRFRPDPQADPKAKPPYGVPKDAPYLVLPQGPTEDDEVNYPPFLAVSFAALGATGDGRLVAVAMFENMRNEGSGCLLGINVWEMAELFFQLDVNVRDAILGGGGADTQQFLRGHRPPYYTAPVRARAPGQGPRAEVEGPRGLGAILAVMAKPLT